MKKFFTLFVVALFGVTMCMTSCKKSDGVKFTFDLTIGGAVNDSITNISSDFNGNVTNTKNARMFMENGVMFTSLDSEEANDVNSWLDQMVNDYVVTNFGDSKSTKYDITINGYVKENLTGLMFQIDKEFKNY